MQNTRGVLVLFILLFATEWQTYSQNADFDSLANELNRIAIVRQTEALALLDTLYQMAYSSSDSSLLVSRCIYEETMLKWQQGIVDSMLTGRIQERLNRKNLSAYEQALLESAKGTNMLTTGNYSEAFSIQFAAMEKYKQTGDRRFTARALNSLGNICFSIGLYSLAEYYFLEAIEYVDTKWHEYYFIKANLYNIRYKMQTEPAEPDSLIYLLNIAEKENRNELTLLLCLNIGSKLLEHNPEKALNYFNRLQTLDFDNPKTKANMYANFGFYYLKNNDYTQALHFFKIAQNIMENNRDFNNLAALYYYISFIHEQRIQFDSALFYSRKQQKISSQLRANTIAIETHQKYITSFLESSKNELIIAEQTIQLKNRRFILIVIILSFTILVALLFLFLVQQQKLRKISENRELTVKLDHEKKMQEYEKRQRKLEKEKQKEALDSKIREITSYSLLVSDKNNLLKQIRELITRLTDSNRENTKKAVAKIDTIIQNSLSADDEWENFKMHFTKIHSQFFKKLKRLCNDLTEDNLKMCAYIKMGMTTKQIAQLLNIADNSVVISRHRIKKKLKLKEDESLSSFIGGL
ncbi:MAG: LuxR C-terminal-related transcriptional regulator [Cytophagaceae bacterium]|nr:LuxR C-terminal-related transcriptional regulator [Cytophagaceae bacterium]